VPLAKTAVRATSLITISNVFAEPFGHGGSMEKRSMSTEEFLKFVEPRFGSEIAARAWFETAPLPGFGDLTAQQLVAAGRVSDVLDLISAIDDGVYS
jgi:hypothetical protein